MVKIALPPTTLGQDLLITLSILATASLPPTDVYIKVGIEPSKGITYIETNADTVKLSKAVINVLSKNLVVSGARRARLPLVPTDLNALRKVLGRAVSGKADLRGALYNDLVGVLKQKDFIKYLDINNVSTRYGRNIEIYLGAPKGALTLPRVMISDGFFELGKLHGIKDVKTVSGPPRLGKVDLRCSPEVAPLMHASVLGFEVLNFAVAGNMFHLFITLKAPPDICIKYMDAKLLAKVFTYALKLTSKFNFIDIYEDYEVHRLYLLLKIFHKYIKSLAHLFASSPELSSLGIANHVFSSTGRRFIKINEYVISLSETLSLRRSLDSLGIGLDDGRLLMNTLANALMAASRLSRRVETFTAFAKLRTCIKHLIYALIDVRLRAALQHAYEVLRILADRDVRALMIGDSIRVSMNDLSTYADVEGLPLDKAIEQALNIQVSKGKEEEAVREHERRSLIILANVLADIMYRARS